MAQWPFEKQNQKSWGEIYLRSLRSFLGKLIVMDPITVIAEHNKYYVLMMNQGLELNVENLMKVMDPDVESVLAKSIYRHPGVARWWRAFQCLDDLKKRSTIVRSKWTRQEVNLLEVYLAARSVYELLDGMSMPGE